MSQKEKARAIVEEAFEFEASTKLSIDEILAAARRAAAASRKMGVGIVEKEVHRNDAGALSAGYRVKGPGGILEFMAIVISGKPEGDGHTTVSLKVGEFLFTKGSLGAKPSIKGHKIVERFVSILKTELAAG